MPHDFFEHVLSAEMFDARFCGSAVEADAAAGSPGLDGIAAFKANEASLRSCVGYLASFADFDRPWALCDDEPWVKPAAERILALVSSCGPLPHLGAQCGHLTESSQTQPVFFDAIAAEKDINTHAMSQKDSTALPMPTRATPESFNTNAVDDSNSQELATSCAFLPANGSLCFTSSHIGSSNPGSFSKGVGERLSYNVQAKKVKDSPSSVDGGRAFTSAHAPGSTIQVPQTQVRESF